MTFTGFRPEAGTFFEQLRDDNTKPFFDAHRDAYVELVRQPMEDLLAAAEVSYGPGRVMRPNRDVRFAADKVPYRTDASMWAGTVGGVYLTLSAAGVEAGGGLYDPTRDQLARARAAIDTSPRAAAELSEIIEGLSGKGFELAGPSLTTAPRGYPKDHPRIDLLRLKHYAAIRRSAIDVAPEVVFATWRDVEPLIEWNATHVGAALSWP